VFESPRGRHIGQLFHALREIAEIIEREAVHVGGYGTVCGALAVCRKAGGRSQVPTAKSQ
jgi:hypothetical protein